MSGTLAITGATGFVGQTLLREALADGWQIRALARLPQAESAGVVWLPGALDQPEALARLVDGADAVIHVAGVTNAPDRAGFIAGNVTGTQAVIAAATKANVSRFIHVSSLSAREPGLSNYGWSKAEAEARVRASGLDWTMVRPPAIYGPGDKDHLDLFKAARWHVIPLPPAGRMSVIAVDDLARLLLALVPAKQSSGQCYEADDGVASGWSHKDYARAIADGVGAKALMLPVPPTLIQFGARLDQLLRGAGAKLTLDRATYFCHPDWVIDPANRPPAALWQPKIETRAGLKATAAAYRAAGWL